jgi:cell wall assembly regulator SMI1
MSTSLFGGLRHLKDASFYPGADISLFDKLEREYGITLPSDHRDVLQESNGAQVYAGYFRLFGIFTATDIDTINWNQADCWKFAWEGAAQDTGASVKRHGEISMPMLLEHQIAAKFISSMAYP